MDNTVGKINVQGHQLPMSIWEQATLLLNLLYSSGSLLRCNIHCEESSNSAEDQLYYINDIPAGYTLDEVTSTIWKMVACYQKNGHISIEEEFGPVVFKRPQRQILGYQVVDRHGHHSNDRPSYLILTEQTAVADLLEARASKTGLWTMVAILEGDIQKPEFEECA
ncbi:hypothetical protein ACI2KR_06720 [Pseudomonas luteola]